MAGTLILCIDRDNDLYEKVKIAGPLVGRAANLKAATKLILGDPEESDANAIFSAIKLYDTLSQKDKNIEIATLTGHKSLGYEADREISKQLDRLIKEYGYTSCVLVSDGASDEQIVPIIKSRIKIDSTKIVYIKQAKELERTYFVILEKLKDPYYARIILGIPALLILFFSFFSYMGYGWQPAGILLGLYLLSKGFGLDEMFVNFFKGLNFSFEKPSWIANLSAFFLLVLAVAAGFHAHKTAIGNALYGEKIYSYILLSILPLLMISVLLIFIGKTIDAIVDKRNFVITRYGMYAIAFLLLFLVITAAARWVVNFDPPYVSFGMLISIIFLSVIIAYISNKLISFIKTNSLLSMKLDGKEVINLHGSYIGRIVGVDGIKGNIIIQNIFDKKVFLPFDSISLVAEQVIVRELM